MANGSLLSMNILITLYILSSIISVFVEGFLAISPIIYDVHKTNANHRHQLLLLKNNKVVHVHKATRLILKSNNNGNDGVNNITRSVLTYTLSVAALLASIGTIYSEVSVIQTGCGPPLLNDIIERSCYLGVIVISGLSVFLRIVTGSGLADAIINTQDDKISLQLFRLVEYLSLLAVLGAFISLGSQTINGEQMDGMSGINVEMCKAIQQS